MSAYGEQVELIARQEQIQKELEDCGEDMDRMADLLDELQELNSQAADLDVKRLDKKIDQMMPELGFSPDDNDRLVASYRRGLLSRGSCMLCHLHREFGERWMLARKCMPSNKCQWAILHCSGWTLCVCAMLQAGNMM